VATTGEPAPDFSLPTLTGSSVRLSDLRGKPVVINFWASWCNPCRKEFAAFRRVLASHKGQFVVLGVDYKDIDSDAATFARQQKASWPMLVDGTNAVSQAYGVRAVPQTFFIAADGTIVSRIYSQLSSDDLERELAKIL